MKNKKVLITDICSNKQIQTPDKYHVNVKTWKKPFFEL